jgi:hypothetical protein
MTNQFATYIELLAELASSLNKREDCRLVNVNSDGARIPNMQHCLPEDVTPAEFPFGDTLERRLSEACSAKLGTQQALDELLTRTRVDLDDMAALAKEASDLCREIADLGPDGGKKTTRLLARLHEVEKPLGEPSPGGQLLSAAVRASSLDTIAFCAGIEETDETGFVRVHEKCRDYYQEIAEMVEWLMKLLDEIDQDLLD